MHLVCIYAQIVQLKFRNVHSNGEIVQLTEFGHSYTYDADRRRFLTTFGTTVLITYENCN